VAAPSTAATSEENREEGGLHLLVLLAVVLFSLEVEVLGKPRLYSMCLGFMAVQVHHGRRPDGCALSALWTCGGDTLLKPGPFPAVALRCNAHSGFLQDGQGKSAAEP
jgi:hypothetical protein